MAKFVDRIPYYRVKKGIGYWEPPAWARVKPYEMQGKTCGQDGPEAREMARNQVSLMIRLRNTGDVSRLGDVWPNGSLGQWYENWRRTPAFGKRSIGAREEFEQIWPHIPIDLKSRKITAIRPVQIEELQIALDQKSPWTRWRTIKKLREILDAAVAHGFLKQSPGGTMSNPEPEGRSQMWTAAEIKALIRNWGAQLVRRGFHPMTAFTLVTEGFIDTAMRVGPAGFRGARTWEQWMAQFDSYERMDRHGRRR